MRSAWREIFGAGAPGWYSLVALSFLFCEFNPIAAIGVAAGLKHDYSGPIGWALTALSFLLSLTGLIVAARTAFVDRNRRALEIAGIATIAAGVIPLRWLLIPGIFCAIAGDQIGYWVGRAAGATLYTRKDSLLFRRSHLERAHAFYEKHGGKTVILARFVPIIRTFCPPVTGAAAMSYPMFVVYDIFGGVLWVGSMLLGGYFLGRHVPNIEHRIHYVIAAVILLSILPPIIGLLRSRRGSGATPVVAAPTTVSGK